MNPLEAMKWAVHGRERIAPLPDISFTGECREVMYMVDSMATKYDTKLELHYAQVVQQDLMEEQRAIDIEVMLKEQASYHFQRYLYGDIEKQLFEIESKVMEGDTFAAVDLIRKLRGSYR